MKMDRLICALLITWGWSVSSFAQTKESLEMFPSFGSAGFEYTKDTAVFDVSPKQVLQIMKDDPLAYAEFKKAKSNYTASGIIGFAGGALIAIPLISAISGGEPEWGLAAGGAALIVSTIPLHRAFKRHAQSAIDTFNKKHTAFRPRTEYYLSGLGGRIVIRF
jgi:hypothetical protein